MRIFVAIIICLLCLGFTQQQNQEKNISFVITGLRSTKGNIVLGVYTNQKNFKDDIPYKRISFSKSSVKNGKILITLSLPKAGTYGISYLDDENKSKEMEYSFWGIPEEGFGFSNYYHTSLSYPVFESFKFELKENEKKIISSKVRYM